jgi:hypothetical protein
MCLVNYFDCPSCTGFREMPKWSDFNQYFVGKTGFEQSIDPVLAERLASTSTHTVVVDYRCGNLACDRRREGYSPPEDYKQYGLCTVYCNVLHCSV